MSRAITEHFSLGEWACHDGSDYPVHWIETRLRPLCEQLEIVRDAIRREHRTAVVRILSGYRSPAHNKSIGGAKHSQHMEGRAADIQVVGVPAGTVHWIVLDLYKAGHLAIGGLGDYPGFTHVDTRPGRLARWAGSRGNQG